MQRSSGKIYDLVVLGAGSGGLEAAYNSAVTFNAKVAVIEPQIYHGPPLFSALGGTCVNVGCIPKKLMYYAAEKRASTEIFQGLGWNISGDAHINWTAFMKKKDALLREINDSYLGMFKETKNLEFIQGWGKLCAEKGKVEVYASGLDAQSTEKAPTVLEAKNILISTGGWPYTPKIPGIEHAITSNELFYMDKRPKNVVIVGGGYIAMEFLCILNGLGVENVHLIYRGDLPLKGFDQTVRQELLRQLQGREGVTLHLNDVVKCIEKQNDDYKRVTTGKGVSLPDVDCIVFCTGRNPRSKFIGLEDAGVHVSSHSGSVIVDDYSRTTAQGVWAVGDVTDRVSLTPVAIAEGRSVADCMFGDKLQKVDYEFIPKAVFSIPPIASVGTSEETIITEKRDAEIYLTQFSPLRFSGCPENIKQKAVFKLVVDSHTKVVLGVHILEPSAPEIIQTVAVALKMGAKISDFYNTVGLHPSSAEELCSMRTPSYRIVSGSRVEMES